MKFKYDKQRKLLFFINSLFPVKGYQYMNICGILFTRNESAIDRMTDPNYNRKVFQYRWINYL